MRFSVRSCSVILSYELAFGLAFEVANVTVKRDSNDVKVDEDNDWQVRALFDST
jgi:hypothetical protein